MVKVSIIVPVYNVEDYLDKCLKSLIKQTLKEIEIIIVNDGTKDKSQIIIDKYTKKYPSKIKSYIKKNGGLGDARNHGIGKATGEYIGFVDGDDYVDATMYEKLYNKAKQDNSDIVECDFYWCYPDKMRLDKAFYYETKENLMLNIRVMVCNKIFKREIIKKNKLTFPVGLRYEDILFTYKIMLYANKISYVNEGLYYYLQRDISLSNNQNEKVRDIFVILNELSQYYKESGVYEEYESILEYLYVRYLLGSSFLRIIGIKNKKLRKEILEENWLFLNEHYPHWKENKYLRSLSGFKNKYYRLTNKFTYDTAAHLFKLKRR